MARLCGKLATMLLALWSVAALAQPREPSPVPATLVPESATAPAGSRVTLAIAFEPKPGWHGYWSNPGEAGFEPRFDWRLAGGAVGKAAFPVPQTLIVANLMNYVYEGPHALLVNYTLPAGVATGTRLPIALNLDYLACTDKICVPQRAELATLITVGAVVTERSRAQFDRWRAAMPVPLGAQASFERRGDLLRLAILYPAATALAKPHFFPAANGLIADAATQSFARDGDLLIAELKAGTATAPVAGVLALGDGRGLTIVATPGAVPPLPGGGAALLPILLALGGAILGGLILNVMPCVFPILSLKALSLAKAGGDEAAARRDALGYTLGAVLVCVALGGAILVLRAGGQSLGWAFQLQDPRVVVVLLMLATAIALNFAGLFELPSVGGNLAAGNSVATGALAAFVATPCTGPFMGAALGAALVLPWPAALAVFAGLGLGLALPFLLLGFVPALRRRLPKPGAWMVTLRHVLSVPMFLTALALVWLLGRLAGADAAAWGVGGALMLGLVLWIVGARQSRGRALSPALAVLLVTITALATLGLPHATTTVKASQTLLAAEPFTETRLGVLRAEGRPVFVYFTADWCLTCKVNERVAIDQPQVTAAFAKGKVTTLVGDWTRSDPVITRFLESQQRSGVPLYLFYPRGGGAPQVLPQVLTPGMLTALVPGG